jgi:hypothetical protein
VCQRSNGYFARNGRLQPHSIRYSARQSQSTRSCVPDSLQDLSGAPPDSPEAPQVRAPTVEPQRSADVAGAPDSVRWRTGLSRAPCDSTLPMSGGAPDCPVRHATTHFQRPFLVVGAINTPTTPHSTASKFLRFYTLQEI